jgi:hypothetical protein
MTTKAANAARSHVRFGRYIGDTTARAIHKAPIASTIRRNVKFLPVIKGKKRPCATISGINGSAKIPPITDHLRTFSIRLFIFIWEKVYPHTSQDEIGVLS